MKSHSHSLTNIPASLNIDNGHSNPDCTEVTCKIYRPDGQWIMCGGDYTYLGCDALGVELDEDAMFGVECGSPEGMLVLHGVAGKITKLRAWITTTTHGQQDVVSSVFRKPIQADEAIHIAGPALRYIL